MDDQAVAITWPHKLDIGLMRGSASFPVFTYTTEVKPSFGSHFMHSLCH